MEPPPLRLSVVAAPGSEAGGGPQALLALTQQRKVHLQENPGAAEESARARVRG